MSYIVNEAVRLILQEDEMDLSAFSERAHEPVLSYEALLADLKEHGKLYRLGQEVYPRAIRGSPTVRL